MVVITEYILGITRFSNVVLLCIIDDICDFTNLLVVRAEVELAEILIFVPEVY